MMELLVSTDFWAILIKCLVTTLISAAIGTLCAVIAKIIIKFNNSKLVRHARIAVRAAEMKYPNEGKKMGPEKMAYVMDYLAVTFPKIKSNQYLYNIAEAAVYELNNKDAVDAAKEEFKAKYGELPDEVIDINEDNNLDLAAEELLQNAAETAVEIDADDAKVEEVEPIPFNLKSF